MYSTLYITYTERHLTVRDQYLVYRRTKLVNFLNDFTLLGMHKFPVVITCKASTLEKTSGKP